MELIFFCGWETGMKDLSIFSTFLPLELSVIIYLLIHLTNVMMILKFGASKGSPFIDQNSFF